MWVLLFAAYFVLSIVAGIIQSWRRKPLWDTPVMGLLAILHAAWVLPFLVLAGIIWVFTQVIVRIPLYLFIGALAVAPIIREVSAAAAVKSYCH